MRFGLDRGFQRETVPSERGAFEVKHVVPLVQ